MNKPKTDPLAEAEIVETDVSAQQLANAPGVLLAESARIGIGVSFGPYMGDWLLRVGQRQHPAIVVHHPQARYFRV